jgi:NodT family efflux transporter outer membrane factor (OMF) lipoprotein
VVNRALVLSLISPVTMALVLVGCAEVGPTYRLPAQALVEAPAANGPFVSGGKAAVVAEPPDRWWELFDNPRLDTEIQRALAANTDLRVADANLERAQALLNEVRAGQEPDVTLDGQGTRSQPSGEQVLQHVVEQPRYAYNLGVGVSYDIDLFGGIRRGAEAASAEGEAAAAARDLVKVNVVAETVRAFADICNAGHEISALNRVVGLQAESLRLSRELIANGRAAPLEQDRQVSTLENARARLPQLEARQRNAAYRLATLQGRPPEVFEPSLLSCAEPLRAHSPLPVGDGQALLKRRPDVRAAERRLAAATARVGVATAALYPDVKFGASIGSTGSAPDFLTPFTNRYAIGPMVSWNLRPTATRARIAGAKADTQARLAAFDGVVLTALRETETALATYAADLERLRGLKAARASAASAEAQVVALRKGGRVGGLAVVDAERTSAIAEQALAIAETDIGSDQISVFLALGGGWR